MTVIIFKLEFHLVTYFKDINSIAIYIGIVSDGDFIDQNAIICATFFPA